MSALAEDRIGKPKLRRLTLVESETLGIALYYDPYYKCQPGYGCAGTMRASWSRSLDRLEEMGLLRCSISHDMDKPYPVYTATELANTYFTRCLACERAVRKSHWVLHKRACLTNYGPDPR